MVLHSVSLSVHHRELQAQLLSSPPDNSSWCFRSSRECKALAPITDCIPEPGQHSCIFQRLELQLYQKMLFWVSVENALGNVTSERLCADPMDLGRCQQQEWVSLPSFLVNGVESLGVSEKQGELKYVYSEAKMRSNLSCLEGFCPSLSWVKSCCLQVTRHKRTAQGDCLWSFSSIQVMVVVPNMLFQKGTGLYLFFLGDVSLLIQEVSCVRSKPSARNNKERSVAF